MSPLHEADVDFADVGTGTLVVMFSVTFKANTAQGKGLTVGMPLNSGNNASGLAGSRVKINIHSQ